MQPAAHRFPHKIPRATSNTCCRKLTCTGIETFTIPIEIYSDLCVPKQAFVIKLLTTRWRCNVVLKSSYKSYSSSFLSFRKQKRIKFYGVINYNCILKKRRFMSDFFSEQLLFFLINKIRDAGPIFAILLQDVAATFLVTI